MVEVLPDAIALRWMKSYARKNLWRVAPWMDLDDMIQLGYEAYYETRSRYATATDPRHIQSLFQLVFRSKIENAVRGNTKQVDDADSPYLDLLNTDHQVNDTCLMFSKLLDIHALIIKAPREVVSVVDVLVKEPEELTKPYEKDARGRRETLNDRLCRILGMDPKSVDLVKWTRDYFEGVKHAA